MYVIIFSGSPDAVHVPKKKVKHSSGVLAKEVMDNIQPNTAEMTAASAMAVEQAVARVNLKRKEKTVDWKNMPLEKRLPLLRKRLLI